MFYIRRKFFWFKVIVAKVTEGNNELTYEELVDEMIADVWYMITEYHLNLGPKDILKNLVDLIKQNNPELCCWDIYCVLEEKSNEYRDKKYLEKEIMVNSRFIRK